ncbi:MAG: tetratricopeptide repeat protein, partial [Acetobacteraceae bacterium]|nr:tetratricopeptide repeat protein [Acetobacteraceae bacterium]
MSDIFQEVQEDLRAERARQFWRRWGIAFGVLAVLVAGAVGGWQAWRWHETRRAEAASLAFAEAQRAVEGENPDFAAAGRRFAGIAEQSPAGYRVLARLRAAALLAEAGDRAGALALWDAVARDPATDPLWRDLAALMWALHGIATEDPAALAARLGPLVAPGA